MNRVLTTSTGEATIVVQKPAPKAAVKWHGMLSVGEQKHNYINIHYTNMLYFLIRLWLCETSNMTFTCHQIIFQDEFFDYVIGHQLCTVYNGITGNVGHAT